MANASKDRKTPETFGALSREALLAVRISSRTDKPIELLEPYCLRSAEMLKSKAIRAPPGLEHIVPAVPLPMRSVQAKEKPKKKPLAEKVQVAVEKTDEFRVLLNNLPQTMLQECMFRVMLEQAKLDTDVTNLCFKTRGEVLITLTTDAAAVKCVKHFHGRQWGASASPVVAKYETPVEVAKVVTGPCAPVAFLSAGAPVFIPPPWLSNKLSAHAAAFVPAAVENMWQEPWKPSKRPSRVRFDSDASTEAGVLSEGESETEPLVMCT